MTLQGLKGIWDLRTSDSSTVIGHAVLDICDGGIYADCHFNDTDIAKDMIKRLSELSAHGPLRTDNKPHIDHVKFNGPATIVFWKDGTKTVVKFDGEGAKSKKLAILYAFIRKIYGEGKNYHYILEEIDNACFSDK